MRYVTLMVMAPGRDRPRRIRFPRAVWKLVLVLPVLLAVVLAWAVAGRMSLSSQNAALRTRNAALVREKHRLIALEGEVARLSRVAYLLENVAGGSGDNAEARSWLSEVEQLLGVTSAGSARAQPDERRITAAEATPHRWPVEGYVTAEFSGDHPGIDIAAPKGSAVRSAGAGTVVEAKTDSLLGFVVTVEHTGGYTTTYGHNSHFVVVPGQEVRAGEVIAFVGSSGRTTGPHLHYEVTKDGTPVDPRTVLPIQQ